jgi:hypothetical protein
MSKSNTTENDFIKIVFLKAANDPAWRTANNLYLALHTADPTDAGDQTSFEATYTGYDRVTVAKDATGWDIAGNQGSNKLLAAFPQCGVFPAGPEHITHVSIGLLAAPGAGQILYFGELNTHLDVSELIQPQFQPSALIVTED